MDGSLIGSVQSVSLRRGSHVVLKDCVVAHGSCMMEVLWAWAQQYSDRGPAVDVVECAYLLE